MPDRTCDVRGCLRPARWAVSLALYAAYGRGPHPPALAATDLAVCDECRPGITVADLVSDGGWETLCGAFEAVGHIRPDRERVEVRFTELTDA